VRGLVGLLGPGRAFQNGFMSDRSIYKRRSKAKASYQILMFAFRSEAGKVSAERPYASHAMFCVVDFRLEQVAVEPQHVFMVLPH